MKILRLAALALLLVFSSVALSRADLFQWVDRDGVLHITDSLKNVPDEYRDKVKTFKSSQKPEVKQGEQVETTEPSRKENEVELYGDETLEWWKETFSKKRQELQDLENAVAAKKQYIGLVDSGTQFGQIYSPENIERYNKYAREIPEDEKKIQALKDDVDELVRKAKIFGVPRHIRGD